MSEEWERNEKFDHQVTILTYRQPMSMLRQDAGIPVITIIFEATLLLNLS